MIASRASVRACGGVKFAAPRAFVALGCDEAVKDAMRPALLGVGTTRRHTAEAAWGAGNVDGFGTVFELAARAARAAQSQRAGLRRSLRSGHCP
jgi:hypothetical protein